MDQSEFSRRLRCLAGTHEGSAAAAVDEYTRILGSLGFVSAVRRVQAVVVCTLSILGSVWAISSFDPHSKVSVFALVLLSAGVSVSMLRRFPYWSPAGALGEGLHALSRYPINDLDAFIRNQRTDLTAVNNTLLSDLCVQLAMDRRRPKTNALDQ